MQASVEIGHNPQQETRILQFPQHLKGLRKDPVGRPLRVVGEQLRENGFKPLPRRRNPASPGRLKNHRTPPVPLRHIPVLLAAVVRIRPRTEHFSEHLADPYLLHPVPGTAENPRVDTRHGLRQLEKRVGGVEKDGSGSTRGAGHPPRQGPFPLPAKSRFHLQVKDFRDTRSAAQASSARWEWV